MFNAKDITLCIGTNLLNSGNALESFIFFVIIFHNISSMKFSEFILYFLVLVPGSIITLPQLKLKEILCFSKEYGRNSGSNLFVDLKASVTENCKCFWWLLSSERRSLWYFFVILETTLNVRLCVFSNLNFDFCYTISIL